MKKLLVTGASGFLGWYICHKAKNDWMTYGTTYSHHCNIKGVTIINCDLTDFDKLKRLFRSIRPDAVIHTAAQTDPNTCQTFRSESRKINVDTSILIAGLCADSSTPCVCVSSDLVFDGLHPPYRETDSVCPVNVYGEQKVLAEKGIIACYPGATICRIPPLFGIPGTESASFIQPMIQAMKESKELKLFVDEFRTPLSVQTAVEGIFLSLDKVTGLVHLGGAERISRYNFGTLLLEILGLDRAKISPCRQKDVVMDASRPPDVSLDSTKALALGHTPLSLRDAIKKLEL
ncbi:MAG: NAD(P)-dependent oxidoreductase [Planctomycetes bacterium]|nr:NAD(P)-dependent oxidoreductase [Planctomycetota bacterium]